MTEEILFRERHRLFSWRARHRLRKKLRQALPGILTALAVVVLFLIWRRLVSG